MCRVTQFARDVASVATGYAAYRRSGVTPLTGYGSMRRLYCTTNGLFNDAVAFAARFVHAPVPEAACAGVLGDASRSWLDASVEALRSEGFCVFDARLPGDDVEALVRLANVAPCSRLGHPDRRCYPDQRGTSNRYDFAAADLCDHESVQRLLADASIRAVATRYLRCEPVLDLVTMWWSEPSPPDVDLRSEAAQLFHFDMDRFKFLKFFVYLTDVDQERGPHCLVRRSHLRKPRALLRDGRHPDAALEAHYPPDDFVRVCGPAGTILVVDTRAFHKGVPLVRGARLLLQLEFAISAFGQNYPRVHLRRRIPELEGAMRRHPRTFSLFDPA